MNTVLVFVWNRAGGCGHVLEAPLSSIRRSACWGAVDAQKQDRSFALAAIVSMPDRKSLDLIWSSGRGWIRYHFHQLFTHRVLLSSILPLWSRVGGFECAVCGCDLASFHFMRPSLSGCSRGFKATPFFHWVPSGKQLLGSYLQELLPAPRGQYAPASHSRALPLSPRGELDAFIYLFFLRYSTKCSKTHLMDCFDAAQRGCVKTTVPRRCMLQSVLL